MKLHLIDEESVKKIDEIGKELIVLFKNKEFPHILEAVSRVLAIKSIAVGVDKKKVTEFINKAFFIAEFIGVRKIQQKPRLKVVQQEHSSPDDLEDWKDVILRE